MERKSLLYCIRTRGHKDGVKRGAHGNLRTQTATTSREDGPITLCSRFLLLLLSLHSLCISESGRLDSSPNSNGSRLMFARVASQPTWQMGPPRTVCTHLAVFLAGIALLETKAQRQSRSCKAG